MSYVTVTDTCGSLDYPITKYVLDRINTPENLLTTAGQLQGYWSSKNYDSTTLIKQKEDLASVTGMKSEIELRQAHAQRKTIDGKEYDRYYFNMPLNSGLAMTSRPLPKDVPLKFTFVRAPPSRALMSIVDKTAHKDLDGISITLNDPQFVATMITSDYYERKYASHRLERLAFPFLNLMTRLDLMKEGQGTFKFTVATGSLPSAMVCLLMEPAAVEGDYRESSMDFKQHNLESIDLQIDSRSIPDYPIKRDGTLGFAFYHKYLKTCNFLDNALSASGLDFESFQKNNFLICVENFKAKKLYTAGQLTMTLKFAEELKSKLYLMLVPIYQKKLNFDENLNVTVSSMRPDDADTVDTKFDAYA